VKKLSKILVKEKENKKVRNMFESSSKNEQECEVMIQNTITKQNKYDDAYQRRNVGHDGQTCQN
jgi:hypothetical protein